MTNFAIYSHDFKQSAAILNWNYLVIRADNGAGE